MLRTVRFEISGSIGELILNRPNVGNAVSPDLVEDLATSVEEAASSEAKVILVWAEGSDFCFGGDIRHLAASGELLSQELGSMAERTHAALSRLRNLEIPIVCAAQGHIVGGGLGIAMCSDILLLSDSARLSTGYSRLGLSCDAGVSYHLTRLIGERRALSWLLRSQFVNAQKALALGIAEEIFPEKELLSQARGVAREISSGDTALFRALRMLVAKSSQNSYQEHLRLEAETIVKLAAADDVAERLQSHLAAGKRNHGKPD